MFANNSLGTDVGGRQGGSPVVPGSRSSAPRPSSVALADGPPPTGGILQHAANLLLGRVSVLAERALARIRVEIIHYASPLLAPPDVTQAAHATLEIAVSSLASPERFAESGERAWATGHKRAAEGFPLLAVLQAYRIGASVLWDGLVETVLQESPDRAHLMVYAANDFWRWVDRDANLMREAHRECTAGLPPDDGRKLLPAFKALLRGHRDPLDLSGATVTLELPLTGRYAVVRLAGPEATRPSDASIREEVDGIQLNWCPLTDGLAVVALLRDRSLEQLRTAVAIEPGVRGGMSPVVDGLAQLGRACELAELALGTCRRDGELAAMEERMSAGFVLSRPDLAAELRAKVFGRLMDLEAADRDLLINTLEVWLDCQGAASEAGVRLYCHRNTVLNRLRRLERLTGLYLERPRDLVDLTLALEAYRLQATDH
ncbi:PucR family transcriptional regulator [Streptomyces sp. NPDC057580]|uniref:PucR family transcriptional regulator n=1 Tax=Streptomyces sp. NPDC057580 TaxID=3346173 RepID=UPI0036C867B4